MTSIIVLAKLPVPGRVKTRLSPMLSPECAALIAEVCLRETLDLVRKAPGITRSVVALERLGQPVPDWLDGFEIVDQCDGGLDRRLSGAFAAVGGPAVLVGMDTPHASSAAIAEAIDGLDRAASTLGLADDGGFWIVGLRQADPRAFTGVPMSVAHTGKAQLERLRSLGHETVLVDSLRDIDEVDDLDYVAREHPATRIASAWLAMRDATPPLGATG